MMHTSEDLVNGSDFGSSSTNQQQTIQYMAGRIAVYTHAIMYNAITHNNMPLHFGAVGRSFFKDCKNSRRCNQQIENNNCPAVGADLLCDGTPVLPSTE